VIGGARAGIDRARRRRARPRTALRLDSRRDRGHGDAWLEWNADEVSLDASHPWTKAVCRHFAATSGGELSVGYLLGVVRNAQQAEFTKAWRS
jgi:hypothetical protein